MSIILYHHPLTRAATVVWMLEELGQPYELRYIDLAAGEQRSDAHKARNMMSKIPVVDDGGTVVAECGAIGVYLADRYSPGKLAPALDDPARGPYLRWCFFAPSVLEPASMAKGSGWQYNPGSAGFGAYETVIETLDEALAGDGWLLGERFTMADVVLGATVRFLLQFNMLDRTAAIGAYADRLAERPALQAALAKNAAVSEEKGLSRN